MDIKREYKRLLTTYLKEIKESETKSSVSLFAYEKFYNEKLEELYQNIINLKKSKQIKLDYINFEKDNFDKKISLYKSCIEKDIDEFFSSIDKQYEKFMSNTKVLTNNYSNNYKKLVDQFSLTLENTTDRLLNEIEKIKVYENPENKKNIKKLDQEIIKQQNILNNLYIKLSDEKKINKNSYIRNNIAINDSIRKTRKDFLDINETDTIEYNNLLQKNDDEIEKSKLDLQNTNKSIIKSFNEALNILDKKQEMILNNDTIQAKIEDELSRTYDIRLYEIKKDKDTDLAKINTDYKINVLRNENDRLRVELDLLRKKRKLEEKSINLNYEDDLEKIEIEKNYIDSVVENNINLEISLQTNKINILKKRRSLLIYKEEKMREFNIEKLRKRIDEISILNMLKCEKEKIIRDCNIDIEYLKLSASKASLDLEKSTYKNQKYIEFLDYCRLINIKNFADNLDFYNDNYSSNSLILLYERNIENAKAKYTIFQENRAIKQRIENLNSEKKLLKSYISILFNYLSNNNDQQLKQLNYLIKCISLFSSNKINQPDSLLIQKNVHKNKYQSEISIYNKAIEIIKKEIEGLNLKKELITEDNKKLNNYVLYYENEISSYNTSIRNNYGNIDNLNDLLQESLSNLNEYKQKIYLNNDTIKKLNKEISVKNKDIQNYLKKIDSTENKINSKFLNTEQTTLSKNTIYIDSLSKLITVLKKVEKNIDDKKVVEKYSNKAIKIAIKLYDDLNKFELGLLSENDNKLKMMTNENLKRYLSSLSPITKEYNSTLLEHKKNKNMFFKTYQESIKDYKLDSETNKNETNIKTRILYENIRNRRIQHRLDISSYKVNTSNLRRKFESDLNEKYLKVLFDIKKQEKNLLQFIKQTNEFKKEAIIRNKNRLKETNYIKQIKLKEATNILKNNKKELAKKMSELNKETELKQKQVRSKKLDASIDYEITLRHHIDLFERKNITWNKEFKKIRKKEYKRIKK